MNMPSQISRMRSKAQRASQFAQSEKHRQSRTSIHILDLPNELLLQIFEVFVESPDFEMRANEQVNLKQLCRTCHLFRRLAQPLLFSAFVAKAPNFFVKESFSKKNHQQRTRLFLRAIVERPDLASRVDYLHAGFTSIFDCRLSDLENYDYSSLITQLLLEQYPSSVLTSHLEKDGKAPATGKHDDAPTCVLDLARLGILLMSVQNISGMHMALPTFPPVRQPSRAQSMDPPTRVKTHAYHKLKKITLEWREEHNAFFAERFLLTLAALPSLEELRYIAGKSSCTRQYKSSQLSSLEITCTSVSALTRDFVTAFEHRSSLLRLDMRWTYTDEVIDLDVIGSAIRDSLHCLETLTIHEISWHPHRALLGSLNMLTNLKHLSLSQDVLMNLDDHPAALASEFVHLLPPNLETLSLIKLSEGLTPYLCGFLALVEAHLSLLCDIRIQFISTAPANHFIKSVKKELSSLRVWSYTWSCEDRCKNGGDPQFVFTRPLHICASGQDEPPAKKRNWFAKLSERVWSNMSRRTSPDAEIAPVSLLISETLD